MASDGRELIPLFGRCSESLEKTMQKQGERVSAAFGTNRNNATSSAHPASK